MWKRNLGGVIVGEIPWYGFGTFVLLSGSFGCATICVYNAAEHIGIMPVVHWHQGEYWHPDPDIGGGYVDDRFRRG